MWLRYACLIMAKTKEEYHRLILGHEVSGTSQDGKYKNKDVVINPLISCEKCDYCKNGREHLCPERTMMV